MLHYCGIILSGIIRCTPYYRGLDGSLHIIDSLSLYFRMFVNGLHSLTIVFFNNVLLRVYTQYFPPNIIFVYIKDVLEVFVEGLYRLAYPYDFGVRLTIFWAILLPYDCCQFPYDSANLRYFQKIFSSGPSFHCGSVYYRLKKRCQNVKILIINPKSI